MVTQRNPLVFQKSHLDFIEPIEDCLGRKASRNYMPMQMGDVPATWADASLKRLRLLTGDKLFNREQTKFPDCPIGL